MSEAKKKGVVTRKDKLAHIDAVELRYPNLDLTNKENYEIYKEFYENYRWHILEDLQFDYEYFATFKKYVHINNFFVPKKVLRKILNNRNNRYKANKFMLACGEWPEDEDDVLNTNYKKIETHYFLENEENKRKVTIEDKRSLLIKINILFDYSMLNFKENQEIKKEFKENYSSWLLNNKDFDYNDLADFKNNKYENAFLFWKKRIRGIIKDKTRCKKFMLVNKNYYVEC